ncbi:hypothetical protein Rhal01_02349 [Rubritalea halochordaticola]|uniref:DUF4410 domain-containing protein n=1 Tax=Rubritalea halochordaticola TaxID=714537 RepID=A0ABP9V0H9_9BACT
MKLTTLTSIITLAFAGAVSTLTSIAWATENPKVIFSPQIEGKDPSGFGVFVRDALESSLTEKSQIILIDRAKLTTSLSESATSEIQSTTTSSNLKITGANFAVYPKISTFNKNTIFTFKVVDLSSTSYRSTMVKADENSDPMEIVSKSADQIVDCIAKLSKQELSRESSKGSTAWSLDKSKPRFTVAIRIPEASAQNQNPDPAGEKQLSSVLLNNAFTIKQLSRPSQSTSIQNALHLEGKEHEALMDECRKKGVEILILGLASSDRATQLGTYSVASARVELSAIRVSDSKVLASSKGYGKASDMSQMVAEKKAIEDAVTRLAPQFIESMVDSKD